MQAVIGACVELVDGDFLWPCECWRVLTHKLSNTLGGVFVCLASLVSDIQPIFRYAAVKNNFDLLPPFNRQYLSKASDSFGAYDFRAFKGC